MKRIYRFYPLTYEISKSSLTVYNFEPQIMLSFCL